MRKLLLAFTLAAVTVMATAASVFADGVGGCC